MGPPELTHFVFLIIESAAEESESHPVLLLDIPLVEFGIQVKSVFLGFVTNFFGFIYMCRSACHVYT